MKPFANSDFLRSRSAFASLAWIRARSACDLQHQRRCPSGCVSALARRVEVGLRLLHLEIVGLGVDPREELALLHRAVEIDEELLDLARDLGADGHRGHRLQRARGRDHGGEGARARPWPAGRSARRRRGRRATRRGAANAPSASTTATTMNARRPRCGEGRGRDGEGVSLAMGMGGAVSVAGGSRSVEGSARRRRLPDQPFLPSSACCSASSLRSARSRASTTEVW